VFSNQVDDQRGADADGPRAQPSVSAGFARALLRI
jgi:hypothetical protein